MLNQNSFKKNVVLAPYTTFKIGGPAQYFFAAKSSAELIDAVSWAKKNKMPYFILAGGSNILISDQGFKGLVILNRSSDCRRVENKVICSSGLKLGQLIAFCAKNNLSGLEFLAGVPGTVGGAVFGNAGRPDLGIGNFIKSVKVLTKAGQLKTLSQKECRFNYRQSRFQKSNEIIIEVVLAFEPGRPAEIAAKIKEAVSLKKKVQPLEYPSAGCIFKNPAGDKSAGWLIEEAGLKGKKIGGAMVSEKHANYIINTGGAKAEEVIILISLIKQKVRTKFKIQFQEEIKLVGF